MFVIFHEESCSVKSNARRYTFATERAAKAQKTRMKLDDSWTVIPHSEWVEKDRYITVKSLMTGTPVSIRMSERGNPAVDPSMEGYWTM